MSNQNDNKMASWLKIIVLGVGAAGAIYGAVKYILGQQEAAHVHNGHNSRTNSSRRRRSLNPEMQKKECTVCSVMVDELIVFLPCTHSVTCEECSARMQKCLTCHRPIAARISIDGKEIPYKPPSVDDDILCFICCQNKKNIIFNCFHTVCKSCSEKVTKCPICRETITSKNLFY